MPSRAERLLQTWGQFCFMYKDPAFLFYSSDFLTGMQDLTMEERGQFITLLCLQHQKGHLSDKMIRIAVGDAAADVMAKFRQDSGGLYYNVRLESEIEKRKISAEKQRQRATEGWKKRKKDAVADTTAYAAALPLVNENENVIEVESISYLSNSEIENTIQYLKITGQRDLTETDVGKYWDAFLIHSEGEKHRNRKDQIQHFRNWLKKQPYESGTAKNSTKLGTSDARMEALRNW